MQHDTAKYGHLLRAVYERPWAISEAGMDRILGGIALASAGEISRDELRELLAARAPRTDMPRSAAVAIVPVHGVISQGQGLLGLLLGGTSVDQIASDFTAALRNREIDGIVLDVNSPGGTIDGVEELASLIRSSRGKKPIAAVANGSAESAAYWLASQADDFAVTPSGAVGSVGVYTIHQDLSAAAAEAGVKTTLISYGKYKTEGNPWEPLGDEAQAEIQSRVNHYGQMFERAVARGRNVSVEKVRADFGQGRSVTADAAVRLGMADRTATLAETVVGVGRGVLQRQPQNQLSAMSQDDAPVTPSADLSDETELESAARSGAWMRNHNKARLALARAEFNF